MGPINSLWFKWRSLKLPWRRTFLAGQDLSGNTFWEFKDALNSNRLRRIVRYNPRTHYGDVQLTPQWHQWLRHTRPIAPTIPEQQAEVVRQQQMVQLAQRADERWASKPSFLDKPREQPAPATLPRDPAGYVEQSEPDEKEGVSSPISSPLEQAEQEPQNQSQQSPQKVEKGEKKNPWAKIGGGPSQGWQPEAWTPDVAPRRRLTRCGSFLKHGR